MSPQKDQEYFCDGMAEEIINALTHVGNLHVVARTSAFSFKGKDVDIPEIGKKLKVENIQEGSIRKAGNRLCITAQLVKVTDGYHLWSERYDRDIKDVFAIQDEISLVMNPNYFFVHWFIGAAYREKSMIEEAIAEYEKAVDLSGGTPIVMTHLAISYYEFGKKAKAEKLFDSLKQRLRDEYVLPMCFYLIHRVRGDQDQAFEWVKRACEEHDSLLPWLRVTPTIETGRIPDEPRFKELLKKAGLE